MSRSKLPRDWDEARVSHERGGRARPRAPDAGGRRRPEPAVEADVDDLDSPVEGVGECRRCPGDRSTGVVGRRPKILEQLPQRESDGIATGRGRRKKKQ